MLKQTKGLQSKGGGLGSKNKGLSQKSKTFGTKKKKNISGKSSKQKEVDEKLAEIYVEMDSGDNLFCTGCGDVNMLEHSHIVPRGQNQKLVTERENITFHCHTCHLIWEHGTLGEMRELDDFEKNMEYIKKADPSYYRLIINKKV